MPVPSVYSGPGFDFANELRYVLCTLDYPIDRAISRNNFLTNRGIPLPKATSTGTTIVGCLFKDGIILGADTRATEGPIVADKNCEKVRASDGLRSLYSQLCRHRFTISQTISDAVVQGPLQTQNSQLLSSPRTWNYTHSLLVANPGS